MRSQLDSTPAIVSMISVIVFLTLSQAKSSTAIISNPLIALSDTAREGTYRAESEVLYSTEKDSIESSSFDKSVALMTRWIDFKAVMRLSGRREGWVNKLSKRSK